MDEQRVLEKLERNGGKFTVSLSSFEVSDDSLNKIAQHFCEVSNLAHKGGLDKVVFVLSDLTEGWDKDWLDKLYSHTKSFRESQMLFGEDSVNYITKVHKVGFWSEDKESYEFSVFEFE